ncbi:cytochrome P450 [Pholiota conissans]|uniref:Cytochrome P450 n=1 Tax=Pholiota conissans TaxID=109636 RepID=A0A9P6D5R5_9AGAR|nr:cytochrome P450 [Pholiota conissans]
MSALNFLASTSALSNESMLSTSMIGLVIAFLLHFVLGRLMKSPAQRLPYPPGPPPRDIITGNARDLMASPKLWLTLTEWAPVYGPIFYLRSLNQDMIVLNTLEDTVELMERRSNNYSDRWIVPLIDLSGWTYATTFKRYGPAWQDHRRLLHQKFRPAASLTFRPIQVEKVNDMLNSLLATPEDFMTHIKTLSAAIIMSAMYGYKVKAKNDEFQELAEVAMAALSKSMYPNSSIVNVLPFLCFLPTWFPGAVFHRFALTVKDQITRMQEVLYKYVQDNLAAGTAAPSFVADFLDGCKTEEDHNVLKETAATAYAAGADTTTSSLGTFFYAMAISPEVQKKAKEELERVIGGDRLATYDDEDFLPYIQAVIREVFRWRPVVPLGVSHSATAEDVYKNYYIPKNTILVPNIWAMTRDPIKYENPEEFNPDRFFDNNGELNTDDVGYTFGFGRRICPGRHMASATMFLAIANILLAFDIRPPKDASGKDISLDVEYTGGLINHPLPFNCSITPRSDRKRLLADLKENDF